MQDAINADNAFNGVSVDAVTSGTRGSTTLSVARPAFDITDLPAAYVTLVGGNNIFGSLRSVKSVASQLQDAIRNNFNNAVVVAVVSGEREDVSLSNSSGTTGNVAFDVSVLGNVPIILSGTDRTIVFGTSPRLVDGFSADASIADALNKISGTIPDWYFVVTDNSFDDDGKNDIANWASASLDKSTILDIVSNDVSAFEDVDSQAYAIANRNSGRVNVLWSRHEDYKGISLAARFSGIDLSGGGIIRTAKFLALPGSSADDITSSQKSILDEARANYYTTFGPTPILAEGVTTSDNIWIDLQYWLDWFAQTMQIELFNLFRGSVPQTDEGLDQMRNVMAAVCALGVINGGIAPGSVTETTAGDIRRFTGGNFSGYLTTGYLVAINAISSQTLSQRATRTAPASRTYLKGSGALHDADIIVDFTQ